jgi:hypothetical protein
VILLLSQAGSTAEVTRIVTVVGVLLVAVLVLAAAVLKLRRRLLGSEDNAGAPLTLHDLRQMHNEGGLTDDEFEKAKAALIGMATKPAAPRSKPQTPMPADLLGSSRREPDDARR